MIKLEALRKLDDATSRSLERQMLWYLRGQERRRPQLIDILKKGIAQEQHRGENRPNLLEPKKTAFSDLAFVSEKRRANSRADSTSEDRRESVGDAKDQKAWPAFSMSVPQDAKGHITGNTTVDSSKSSKWTDSKKDKSGVLALGDILSLMVKDINEEKAEIKVVSGDGIANVEMECAPKSFFDTNGEQARFRQCLFKVETASQYGLQTRVKKYKDLAKVSVPDTTVLKAAEVLAEDEAEANNTEAWEVLGRAVAYGDRIQLRHLQSDSYVTISEEIAREPGCLKVVLDKDGNEGSWLMVVPCNKLRKEGEVVRYSDPFNLRVSLDKSDYFLHLAKKVGKGPDNIRELNGCISASPWKARKFISHAELKKNPEFVSTGDSFRIILKQNDGYLTVTSPNVASILPPKITVASEKGDQKKQEVKEQKPDSILYVDFEKTSLNVWELERKRVSVGGIALEHEVFRLKNVSTGLFLAVEFGKTVLMTKDGNKDTVLFKFLPEDLTGGPLKFKTLLRIQHFVTKKFIQAKEGAVVLQGLFGEEEDQVQIAFTVDIGYSLTQVFVFEDEAEDKTVHIHQVSLVLPKIVSYYRFLQEWGLIQRKGIYFPDFEVARSTESDLEANSKQVTQILANVTRRVLKDEEAGLKLRQQSFLESNLLSVLMKLAELLHDKVRQPKGTQKKGEGEESTSQMLAEGHLEPLARQLYKTLLSAIRNNPDCCQVLYSHAAFLSQQLSLYKVEVGKLLKETFRHSARVEHSVRQEELSTWLKQIRPLSEAEDNLVEQTVFLKIMCSLCLADGKALPKFQNIIDEGLATAERKGKLCKFRMYSGEPCFELNTGNLPLEQFLEANPILQTIGKKVEDEHTLVVVFFIHTVTPHKAIVNYLAAILDILIHICHSRNSKATARIIHDYNISFDFTFTCMKDVRISLKLRERFSSLSRALFLDRDPLLALRERRHACYLWDEETKQVSNEDEENMHIDLFPFLRQSEAVIIRVTELVQWLQQVWVTPDYPYQVGLLIDRIHFVTELLQLTKVLIDLGYTGYEFFTSVHESILRLIAIDSGTDKNWCDYLNIEIKKNKENIGEAVLDMTVTALEVLKIGCCDLRKERELAAFCNVFGRLKDTDSISEQQELLMFEVFRANEFKTRNSNSSNPHQPAKSKSIKKISPEFKFPQVSLDFDQVILRLFLLSTSRRIHSSAIPMILSNFSQRLQLKEELHRTVLLESTETRVMFKKLQAIHGRLFVLMKEIKFASDISQHNLEKTASQELHELFITLQLICIEVKKLLDLHLPADLRNVTQNTAKNLGLLTLLLHFLEEDFPWISRGENGAVVLPTWTINTYRDVIKCLFLSSFRNLEVQKDVFEHISGVIKFIANDVGCAKLMREAIASQRSSAIAARAVDYVIGLLNSHPEPRNRPSDLSILERLVIDDDGKLHKRNQEIVFKAVTQNQSLMRLYEDEGSLNLTLFKQDTDMFIRFHGELIRLLALCAMDNRVVMFHCQRLLPFYALFREICKENLHLLVKREYMQFIFCVYALELTDGTKRGLPLNEFYELFNAVVIPDLEQYEKHLLSLKIISQKGLLPSVYCSQAKDFAYNNTRSILERRRKSAAAVFTGKGRHDRPEEDFDMTSLSKDQQDSLQYWKYLTNHKPWARLNSSGLLQFIQSFSKELNIHNHPCSPELFTSLDKMKQLLGGLLDAVMEMSTIHQDLEFDSLIGQLNDCIQEIPNYILDEAAQESDPLEQKAYDELLLQLKLYLERTHLSLSEFFRNLHPTVSITKKQLLLKLKDILGRHITSHQLILALNFMDQQMQQQYDLKDFHSKMKKYLHRSKYIVRRLKREEELTPESRPPHINSELQLFLKTRYENISNLESEPAEMGASLRTAIVAAGPYCLSDAFSVALEPEGDSKSQLFLMKSLVQVVQTTTADPDDLKEAREWLCSSGIIELAIELCCTCNDSGLSEQCLRFVSALLNAETTIALPKVIQKLTDMSFPFFSFCVSELRSTKDRIHQLHIEKSILSDLTFFPAFESVSVEAANRPKPYSLSKQILLLIQNCCNTCNRDYQNLFRMQQSSAGSVNLVNEISMFLIFLRNIPDTKDKDSKSEAWVMCKAVLVTLIHLMSGACVVNQQEIGLKKAMYQFVNWIIEDHYLFNDDRDKRLEILRYTVKLMLGLVEGAKESLVADIIIKEVNISDLSRTAESLYSQLIHGRVQKVLQDSAGVGKSKCKCFELVDTTLTLKQRCLIDMAFDIRILLKHLGALASFDLNVQEPQEESTEAELSNLKLKKFENRFFTNVRTTDFHENLPKGLVALSPFKTVLFGLTHPTQHKTDQTNQLFFEAFISNVDVNYRGEIIRLSFRIPAVCSFAPRYMRRHLVKKIAILSHQDKLRKFVELSETYELEMKHRQELGRFPLVMGMFKKWRGYCRVSFFLIVIINLMLLFSLSHDSGTTGKTASPAAVLYLTYILGSFQLLLSFMIFISYTFLYYPVIVNKRIQSQEASLKRYLAEPMSKAGHKLSIELNSRASERKPHRQLPFLNTAAALLLDVGYSYNLLYLLVSIIAIIYHTIYPILLLDFTKRSTILFRVLQAIWRNIKSLLLVLLLCFIIVYGFSIIAFLDFSQYYDPEYSHDSDLAYCGDLLQCSFSTFFMGVRAVGGIGAVTAQANLSDRMYVNKLFFDLFFYLFISLLFLALVFGIIVNSLAESREKEATLVVHSRRCFICGSPMAALEANRINWQNHVYCEHNIHSYMFFLVYIRNKPTKDCIGVERFVKEELLQGKISFFPLPVQLINSQNSE